MQTLMLNGDALSVDALGQAARHGAPVALDPAGLDAMARTHALVDRVIQDKTPVYGVTTGLGARATEVLDNEALKAFSLQTLRGRAHAVGPEEDSAVIRANLIVRLNTLLKGHSAAQPALAQHIAACLNAGLTPVTGRYGSIGAADLVLNASIGLSLIGEGQMRDGQGQTGPSAEMMQVHGITPPQLAPRDGLALANHSGAVSGMAALALSDAARLYEATQTAAALSMEGFRANTGPLMPHVLQVKPYPGQLRAAAGLRDRLAGGALLDPGQARRLQDPLSFRNLAQIHGTTDMALTQATDCLTVEINSASDNPVALPEQDEITSCGAYFTAEICSTVETLNRALVAQAMAQLARIAKLLNPVFSDLPNFLAIPNSASNGFAPVMKVAEALVMELTHAAQPAPIWPSVNANGIEDCLTGAPKAVRSLTEILDHLRRLTAVELLIACQAVELRECTTTLGPWLSEARTQIRVLSPALEQDRPLGADIDRLATAISSSAFTRAPATPST